MKGNLLFLSIVIEKEEVFRLIMPLSERKAFPITQLPAWWKLMLLIWGETNEENWWLQHTLPALLLCGDVKNFLSTSLSFLRWGIFMTFPLLGVHMCCTLPPSKKNPEAFEVRQLLQTQRVKADDH